MLWIKLTLLSLQEIWKNKIVYLLFSFELILVSIMAISLLGKLIGVVSSKDLCYAFEDKNMYYYAKYDYIQKDLTDILDAEILQNMDMISLPLYSIHCKQDTVSAYGYDDALLPLCHYKMSEGIWFHEYKGENIPVISMDEHYAVGDKILLDDNHQMEVIGFMNQESYIINFHASSGNGESSLDQFISHPDVQMIVACQSRQFASVKDMVELIGGENNRMIFLHDTSYEEKMRRACKDYGAISSFSEMKQNYEENNRYEFMVNGIVLLIFVIVSITGMVGYNEIRMEINRQRILIYQLNGTKIIHLLWMEWIKNLVLFLCSYLLFYVVYRATGVGAVLESSLAVINYQTFAGILLFLGMVILISSLSVYHRLLKTVWISAYKRKQ